MRVSRTIKASRSAVYKACIEPGVLAQWRAPDNMSAHVHAFDASEGGRFRISLTYKDSLRSPAGTSSEGVDTFQGRFLELLPDEKIVEAIEFESQDPGFAGEMKVTTSFADTDEGTQVTALYEDMPAGIRQEDNRVGTEQSLRKLAALLER
jgi:uncharacterized protein YndB with AHSA1/START domain